jgi:hypothetical protein
MEQINLLGDGGAGDLLLSIRLKLLLSQLYPKKYNITNFFSPREEIIYMLKILYATKII